MTQKQLKKLIKIADYLADLATNISNEYGRVDLDDIQATLFDITEDIKKIIIPEYEKHTIEEYESRAMEIIENNINQLREEEGTK